MTRLPEHGDPPGMPVIDVHISQAGSIVGGELRTGAGTSTISIADSGLLTVNGGRLELTGGGTTTVNQTGGTVTVNNNHIVIGRAANALSTYNISAVLANAVLGNALGATIPANTAPVDNVGGPLNPAGGTLVYNRRGTVVPAQTVIADNGARVILPGGTGPLHDPTTVAWLLKPDLFRGKFLNVEIETTPGLCFGQTVVDRWSVTNRPKNATWITHVDADGFFELILDAFRRLP